LLVLFEIQDSFPRWGNLHFRSAAICAKQTVIAVAAGPADLHGSSVFTTIGNGLRDFLDGA